MNSVRSKTTALMMTIALGPNLVIAQDLGANVKQRSPQDVFAALPGDAWAVVCVPSLAELDRKLVAFAQQLQLPMMGPPLGMAKMMLGVMGGFDDNGGLALALLPTNNLGAVGKSIVVFVPISGFDEFVAPMSPQPADNGMTKIYFLEKETYAAPFGKFAVLAQNSETLAQVLAKRSLRDVLAEQRLTRLKNDDLTLWVNLHGFTSTDLFAGYAMMLKALNADAEMIKQLDTAALSLRFDKAGVNIGMYADADPASDIGRSMAANTGTDTSLLIGLPAEPYLLAAGSVVSEDAGKQGAEMFKRWIGSMSAQAGDQKELVEGLGAMVANLLGDLRHTAVSVSALPPGSDGMFALAVVITTDGASNRVRDTVKNSISTIKAAFAGDAQVAQYTGLVTHTPDAEKVGGRTVDHLKINLPFEPGSEEMAKAAKIIGTEGLLFRLARTDEDHVVITFGGGQARLTRVMETVEKKGAPLANEEGIKTVASSLPKRRNSEGYIAVDRVIKLIASIGKSVGDPLPIAPEAIPDVNAPLAVVTTPVAPAGSQTELFIPMALIRAVKDVGMAQMMAPPAPQPQPAPTESGM